MKPVMTFFPETRLAKLAARPGGIMRDIAIEKAKEYLESMRGEGDEAIRQMMDEIEKIAAGAQGNRLPLARIKDVLRLADQTVTLAGTFDYDPFGRCMKSLCDVADGLLTAGIEDAAPIVVHVRTMRLVAPGSTTLSPEQTEVVLGELAKILTHYDFKSLGSEADAQTPIAR
jgi:hypothetical protein